MDRVFTILTLLLMDPLFPEQNLQSKLSDYMANFPTNVPNTMKSFVYILGNATFPGIQSNTPFYHHSMFPTRLQYSNQDENKGFTIFYTELTGHFKFTFPLLEYFLAAVHIHQQPALDLEQKMIQQGDSPFMWQFFCWTESTQ